MSKRQCAQIVKIVNANQRWLKAMQRTVRSALTEELGQTKTHLDVAERHAFTHEEISDAMLLQQILARVPRYQIIEARLIVKDDGSYGMGKQVKSDYLEPKLADRWSNVLHGTHLQPNVWYKVELRRVIKLELVGKQNTPPWMEFLAEAEKLHHWQEIEAGLDSYLDE